LKGATCFFFFSIPKAKYSRSTSKNKDPFLLVLLLHLLCQKGLHSLWKERKKEKKNKKKHTLSSLQGQNLFKKSRKQGKLSDVEVNVQKRRRDRFRSLIT